MIISINKIEADVKALWMKWRRDAIRIWKHSPVMFVILALTQLIFGFIPFIVLRWFGEMIDTIQGARSLGLWTDDMTHMMWMWLGILFLFFINVYITRQFRDASASVARGIRWTIFIISILAVLLPVAPFVISVLCFMLTAEVWIQKKYRFILWMLITILVTWLYWQFAEHIVFNLFTAGEGIMYAGLLFLIPLRQFTHRYFVCA